MTNASDWEQRFVKRYIDKRRRDRYPTFLTNEKRRRKILNRLCHSLDYDETRATLPEKHDQTFDRVLELVREQGVSSVCYLMAYSSDLDGSDFELETAVKELLFSSSGAVLICPPKPIALYKPEDIGILILLK